MSDAPDTVPYGRFKEVNDGRNAALDRIKELEAKIEKTSKSLKAVEGRLESVVADKDKEIARLQVDHQADLALAFLPDDGAGPDVRTLLRLKYESLEVEEGQERPPMSEWVSEYRETAAGKSMLSQFEAKPEPKAGDPKPPAPPRATKPDQPGKDPTHDSRVPGSPPPPSEITPDDLARMTPAQIKELGGIDAIVARRFGNG